MNKKKGMFDGFKSVFSFTTSETIKGKGFKSSTIGIFLLLFVIMAVLNVIIMFSSKTDKDDDIVDSPFEIEESGDFSVDKLLVYENLTYKGESGSKYDINVDVASIGKILFKKDIAVTEDSSINTTNLNKDALDDVHKKISDKLGTTDKTAAILIYSDEDNRIVVETIGFDKVITGDDVNASWDIAQAVSSKIKADIVNKAGIKDEMIAYLYTPANAGAIKAGEETNIGVILVQMLAPMAVCLFVYMMVLINGQTISKSVIAEKSNKLMETLLVSVRPYAVIAGKVVSLVTTAIIQFLIWVAGGVLGFIVGNKINNAIDPDYSNAIYDVIELIRDNAAKAFTLSSVIMAIIFVVVGFFTYSVFSAYTAALASKPEDLSSMTAIFQFPLIIGFLGAYFAPLIDNDLLTNIVHFVPITAPFSIPADLLVGKADMLTACISLVIVLLAAFLLVYITGKAYKARIFGKNK